MAEKYTSILFNVTVAVVAVERALTASTWKNHES